MKSGLRKRLLTSALRRSRFSGALDEAYQAFLLERQERISLPALYVGTAIMTVLLPVDYFVIPDVFLFSVLAGFLAVLPVAAVVALYLRRARRSLTAHYIVVGAVTIFYGTVSCLLATSSSEPLAPIYLTANNITILFATLIIGLPPRFAALVSGVLIVMQAILAAGAVGVSPALLLMLTSLSAAVAMAGLFGNWRMHTDQRWQFLSQERDRRQLRRLDAQNAILERLSVLDPLTGMSNRRGLDALFEAALTRAKTDPSVPAIALAMIDVDHFKLFNDTHGHVAGDEALKTIANALMAGADRKDVVARYGGEEFAVLMPDTHPMLLNLQAAGLRSGVERAELDHPASPTADVVTVSIGLVYVLPQHFDEITLARLVEAADAALYRAKTAGRNRVSVVRYDDPAGTVPVIARAV